MTPPTNPKIAFVGWNPFQFLHFGPLAAKFPDATSIIETRNGIDQIFDFKFLEDGLANVIHLDKNAMRELDGQFDVLLCQTPFEGIEEIRKSKIAMLQYGYAKQAHNFGTWRSFADLTLTFGDYASHRITPFCPCVATGNPRYDAWHDPSFKQNALKKYANHLDPAKPTILYAPTWGDLSSYIHYSEAIRNLAQDHNVILKIHHNSQLAGKEFMDSIHEKFTSVCDTKHDIVELLAVSDLMISDYSGAIFDAIHCRIPVVLLNHSGPELHATSTSDKHSLEQTGRTRLGTIVESPAELAAAVASAHAGAEASIDSMEDLRNELFTTTDASTRAQDAILDLVRGRYPCTQAQQYIRHDQQRHYRCRAELSAARTFGGFLKMTSDQIYKRMWR